MATKKTNRKLSDPGPWAHEDQTLVDLVDRLFQRAKQYDFIVDRLGVGSRNSTVQKLEVKDIQALIGIDAAALSRWATGKERRDRAPDHEVTNNALLRLFSGDLSYPKTANDEIDGEEREGLCQSLLDHLDRENPTARSILRKLLERHGKRLELLRTKREAQKLEQLLENARRSLERARTSQSWSIDLWTPGQTAESIISVLGDKVDPSTAGMLAALSDEAIAAIGRGDFVGQLEVADKVISLGRDIPGTSLLGEGYYLKADAVRLMADFNPEYGQQEVIRRDAADLYELAIEELHGDPRAVRGYARTQEALGAFDQAGAGYQRAYLNLEMGRLEATSSVQLPFRFEYIRTLRHKLYNLATLLQQSIGIGTSKDVRAAELRHFVMQSEALHQRDLAPRQGIDKNWLGIERFASAVMHAKAWYVLEEREEAAKRMCEALEARIEMMSADGPMTSVEVGNFAWWASSAMAVEAGFSPRQRELFLRLVTVIETTHDRALIQAAAKRLLAG